MHLFFLTIPKPPCPLVPYVAGGSDSIRFKKKSSIPLSPLAWNPTGLEAEAEANIQGFRKKTP
jgi:hypothetical protein